jgi:hypothetical protein
MQAVSGPAMAVAPGLNKLADALSTPGFAQLPNQLSQFTEVMTEMSKRLGPLTQFAESAGGLFGGLRLPGMGTPARQAPSTPGGHDIVARERTVMPEPPPTGAPSSAERSTATKSSAGKAAARRRAPANKTAAKKAAAKKAAAKKPATKTAAKKTAAKKPATK